MHRFVMVFFVVSGLVMGDALYYFETGSSIGSRIVERLYK